MAQFSFKYKLSTIKFQQNYTITIAIIYEIEQFHEVIYVNCLFQTRKTWPSHQLPGT